MRICHLEYEEAMAKRMSYSDELRSSESLNPDPHCSSESRFYSSVWYCIFVLESNINGTGAKMETRQHSRPQVDSEQILVCFSRCTDKT